MDQETDTTKKSEKEKIIQKSGEKTTKKKKIKEDLNYSIYIFKILKEIHPNFSISKNAMAIMNSFMSDLFQRIVSEASHLVQYTKSSTLTSRDVQTATRLLVSGNLAKHSMSQGTKAITKYIANK